MRSHKDPLQKARDYAFLLLKFRLRSEKEIYERLKKKNFDPAVIKETLDFLKAKRFLDDRAFAKAWIDSRLKRTLGPRRVKVELKLKGIAKEIIDQLLSEARENYSEQEQVDEIARNRLSRLKGIEPRKQAQRIYAYLLRRGFSPETIMDSLNKLCKQTS